MQMRISLHGICLQRQKKFLADKLVANRYHDYFHQWSGLSQIQCKQAVDNWCRPPTCPKILNFPKFCMFYFFVPIYPTLDWKVLICPNFSCLGKLKALFLLYIMYSFVPYMLLKNCNLSCHVFSQGWRWPGKSGKIDDVWKGLEMSGKVWIF